MNRISQRSLPSCIQWEISLASLKHCVVCLLGLTGLEEAQRQTHACACTHKHTHAHTPSPQRRPLSSSPRGNDDSHYRLKARWPQCPYSAALLSYQTASLYWCSIISFPLSFRVHQGVVWWGRGRKSGKSWREKAQLAEIIPSHGCWNCRLTVEQSLATQTPLLIS